MFLLSGLTLISLGVATATPLTNHLSVQPLVTGNTVVLTAAVQGGAITNTADLQATLKVEHYQQASINLQGNTGDAARLQPATANHIQ